MTTTANMEEIKTNLPPRYQIRKLEPSHLDWIKAIIAHSNLYNSPIWSVLYPEPDSNPTTAQRAYNMFRALDYHHLHAIASGHSYGIFDTEYTFKHPSSSSSPEGGKLHWDFSNPAATGADLLSQMDFPLVHVSLAYDAFSPFDKPQLAEFISHLPELGILFSTIEKEDDRTEDQKKPKGKGEMIIRAGTCTRGDYQGLGLAKEMAHWFMKVKAKEGFRSIQIDSAARAVDAIWGNPPAPFHAEVVGCFESRDLEVEVEEVEGEGGKVVKRMRKPFWPADVWCARTVVVLRFD